MEIDMDFTAEVYELINVSRDLATEHCNEYLMPEHFLVALLEKSHFWDTVLECHADPDELESKLLEYLDSMAVDNLGEDYQIPSFQFKNMIETASIIAESSARTVIEVHHIVDSLLDLNDSKAAYLLLSSIDCGKAEFMATLLNNMDENGVNFEYVDEFEVNDATQSGNKDDKTKQSTGKDWKKLVTCVNDILQGHNPLVGREQEIETTLRILCRKDKNNVLHIGDPGVGKTALIYGLAQMINDGRVPDLLRNARIYQVDMATLLAGTQYRGEFEKRFKIVMDGVSSEEAPIVYIDEIHNIVGAGATNDNSIDASNMLKPYLEAGKIRFIGSTTYDDYKRYFAKSKSLVRRFSQIDIHEPSVEDTIKILNCLRPTYEQFHGVVYTDDAIDFAVCNSQRYIADRFLPDKAIDLIDEAGAYRRLHPLEDGCQTVDKALIAEVLAKTCKIDAISHKEEVTQGLEDLKERLCSQIFGQDKAVSFVAEAVQMAKAGLTEANKPLASLLFVGPTGVGKTEVARVLAQQLGVNLLRFDMSEYAEKHSVAKLIGAPAGYVGYEDGGMLVDAVRRSPNCVLLLDEIEKAHPDIYNILLQVMDYARLTDNRGNFADFSNVVLIMTSNAGAQYANLSKIGYGNQTTSGEAMMAQVKKQFKPEFINRLSATVVFNDLNIEMASLILDKKLRILREMLSAKNVTLTLSDAAHRYILKEGFTSEYGARELDRVINSKLKPLLMRSILFGSLKNGGDAYIGIHNGELSIK